MVQNHRNSIPSVNESLLIRQKVNTNEAENGQYIRNASQYRSEYDLKMVQSSRSPDKSAKCFFVVISQPKHMLWILKRAVSKRRFFRSPKTC